ncbi:MAG TPA: HWE histidine kinase domain-containing protein [Xanthobacteraceae bacterium]|jgi:two-component sensor histidine kinase|nr:HWE histidine kinase domain-containing protein [Xanthobacteraceae bacterium]
MLHAIAPKLADIYITKELYRRTPGKVDVLREKRALQEIAALMADDPAQVLPKFVSLAMEMTEGVSAGLSLLEEDPAPGVFRWHHLTGTLARFTGSTTPRNFSPCGIVLDMDAPVLTAYSERGYDWIAACDVELPEVLLVPLHIDRKEPTGTLWIVSDKDEHFHREHARAMTELASFVAIAIRMLRTEQKLHAALDEQVILTREMTHRIKNLFAMTDGMIRFTEKSATTPKEMSALLSGRLHALANANALVRREFSEVSAPTSDLRELIKKIAEPHEHSSSESARRFFIEGPTLRCGERASNAIALIFHELATNAAKYGSLKLEEGRVRIVWRRREDSLQFEWTERHGPPIEETVRGRGFGGELVQRMVGQFKGTVDYDWQRAGLVAKISFPIAAIAE